MSSHYVLKIQYVNKPPETRNIGARVTTIGREAGDIVLGDPQSSGRHAEIHFENDSIRVKDLGSTNGTFFNGQRTPEFALQPGQGFSIGQTVMTLMAVHGADQRPGGGKTLVAMGGMPPRPPGAPPGAPPGGAPRPPGAPPAAAAPPPGAPPSGPGAPPSSGPGAPPPGAPPQQGFGAPPPSGPGAPPSSGPGAPPSSGPGAPPPGAPPQQGFGAPPPSSGPGAPPQQGFGAPPSSGPGAPPSSGPGAPPPGGAPGAPPQSGGPGAPSSGPGAPPPGGAPGAPPPGGPGGGPPGGPPPGGPGQGMAAAGAAAGAAAAGAAMAVGGQPGHPGQPAPMGGAPGGPAPMGGGPGPMAQPGAAGGEIRGDFSGSGGELFGQLFVGALLTGITFGIYYPWFLCKLVAFLSQRVTFGPTSKGTIRPNFEGQGGDLFVTYLVGALLTGITFGIYAPWFMCKLLSWFTEHTVFRTDSGEEYKLKFEGEGGDLFVTYLVGAILTGITFGIYTPWFMCKMLRWLLAHTKITKNGQQVGSAEFTGEGGDLFITYLKGAILTGITFGIYGPWFMCTITRWQMDHTKVTVEGQRLGLRFTGEGKELLIIGFVGYLLTLITFGIYGFWFMCKLLKWQLSNTVIYSEGSAPAMGMGGGNVQQMGGQPMGQPQMGMGQPPMGQPQMGQPQMGQPMGQPQLGGPGQPPPGGGQPGGY